MHKREAVFQTLFKRWIQARWQGGPAVFELKRTLTFRIPLSDVKGHQIEALSASHGKGLYYKIPDDSYGLKPFDCFFLKDIEAYVVIAFGPTLKRFHLIPIDAWQKLCAEDGRKSVHEDDLDGISVRVDIHSTVGK